MTEQPKATEEQNVTFSLTAEEIANLRASYARRKRLYRLCLALWIPGTIVILLSWSHTVSAEIGWIGFGVAGAGWVLSMFVRHIR